MDAIISPSQSPMRSITNTVSAAAGAFYFSITMETAELIPIEAISQRIFIIRGVNGFTPPGRDDAGNPRIFNYRPSGISSGHFLIR